MHRAKLMASPGDRRRVARRADARSGSVDDMAKLAARKKGTANDWVHQVLEGAVRDKFRTPEEREAAAARQGGETRNMRRQRLSKLYAINSTAPIIVKRSKKPVLPPPPAVKIEEEFSRLPTYIDEKEPEWSLSGAWRPATASVSTAQLPTSPIGTAGMDRRSYLTSTFGPEFFMRRPRSTTARSHSAFVGAGASMMDSTGEPTPQWTAALTGSPRTWPAEVGYVQGFKRDPSAPALCEEFRPSSRSSRDRSPTGSRSGSHAGSRPTSGSAAVGAKRVRVTDQRHSVAEGDSYVLRGSRAGRGGRSPSPGAVEGDSFVLAGEAARMRRAASTPGGKSRPGSRARSTLSRSVSFHPTVSDAELRRQKAARKERKKKAKSISMQRRGLKYWSACTVMYSQSETEQSLKASAQRMQKERAQRSKMKWKELLHLYNCLRAPTRRQVGVDEIDVLYSQLRKACAEAGSANSIGREAFWRIVGQVDMPMTSANRLYSGFDTERRDEMDIREFVCSLRLFRKYGTEPLIDKLVAMFDYYLYHDHTGKLRRADVVSLLQTCAEKELDKEVLDRMAQKAMNERLGTKSLWAVDMTKDDLKGILEDNPYLLNTIQRQLDENMPAH